MRAYKSHFNLQGHHPKVRPWNRHADFGVSIKVARLLSPKVMLLRASDDELLETTVVEMGCPDSGMWYVDTAGCAMLQANDAEPPPQRGWLRKAVQCAAVFLLGLMLLAGPTSCKKDPQPSPTPTPTPTDTITPVVPGDTITPVTPGDTITPVVPGDTLQPGTYDTIPNRTVLFGVGTWPDGGLRFPTMDTVQFYANHPGCDTIYLVWCVSPGATTQWVPGAFHVAFDSLERRFNLTDKCYGARDIVVSKNYGGASIPDEELLTHSKYGMTVSDSIRCTNWGYHPRRDLYCKPDAVQPPRYNGNRVLKAGRSR